MRIDDVGPPFRAEPAAFGNRRWKGQDFEARVRAKARPYGPHAWNSTKRIRIVGRFATCPDLIGNRPYGIAASPNQQSVPVGDLGFEAHPARSNVILSATGSSGSSHEHLVGQPRHNP
jgi:hypothetical protein